MACLKNGIVANLVVPHPDYVRFAAHYGFRPDFCEGGDPESKGVVENMVGYAQRDMVVPANKIQTIRFGSARSSLPTGWVGKLIEVSVLDHEVVLAQDEHEIDRHPLMAPGEVSIKDEHYQGRTRVPARAVRIRTGT